MIGYPKLVRDRIPNLIRKKTGKCPITHIATDEEYRERLDQKLLEETFEYLRTPKIEELADIMEVVYAIAKEKNVTKLDLYRLQRKKGKQKGKFLSRIILDEIK